MAGQDDGVGAGVGGGHIPQPGGAVIDAVASQRPSGLKATASTVPSWPARTMGSALGLAAVTSHSRAVSSGCGRQPAAIRAEGHGMDGILMAGQDDGAALGLAAVTSHSRAVLSADAVASQRPSGLKATASTHPHGRPGRWGRRWGGGHVPQPGGVVPGCGRQPAAIRAEGHGTEASLHGRSGRWGRRWGWRRSHPTAGRCCPRMRSPASGHPG